MGRGIDVALVNPGDGKQIYQDLGKDHSAIEPPYWIATLASYLRNNGFAVAVIDAHAENIAPEEIAGRINELNPLLTSVVVYGSHPSASTQTMTVSGKICRAIKEYTSSYVSLAGLHPSALPRRTIEEESVDFVIEGEGPYTMRALLRVCKSGRSDFSQVPGLWYSRSETIYCSARPAPARCVDEILPIAAWDLLPMQKYRAHNWHCFDPPYERAPYAALYTSVGCPYNCVFCCINAPFGKPGVRYRTPSLVLEEIELLVNTYGIKNIKIMDELFVFNEKHYMTIVDALIRKGYALNIWAYSRVDTIKPENLRKMKKAGINWLALGIESANPGVRNGAQKKMRERDIKDCVRAIQSADIRVIGNYIFGLPHDTLETMEETLALAVDLNCEFANFYCAMAYPGSRLYTIAVNKRWDLPGEWEGFSQHSYGTTPLSTEYLSSREVLQFRDDAFHRYFENPLYLKTLERTFGTHAKEAVCQMTKTRLKRKLLGN